MRRFEERIGAAIKLAPSAVGGVLLVGELDSDRGPHASRCWSEQPDER
jgi:hypothetical protein